MIGQDLRYAVRKLLLTPGFTAVAVLTLAVGIGATTAIFSVVNGVLLKPLPYPDSGQLVLVAELTSEGSEIPVAGANFKDWRAQTRSFQGLAAFASGQATVLGGTEPVRPEVASVTTDFFLVLGTRPFRGRTFSHEETAPGGAPVAVVSHEIWRDYLAGADDLSGRTLQIYGSSYEVVGVMPAGFQFPGRTGVWIPESLADPGARSAHNWHVVGRLRPGTTVGSATRELTGVQEQLRGRFGDEVDGVAVGVTSLHDSLVGSARRPLLLLLGAAALVLIIACANLASTLLARGSVRRGEMAIRSALGASRGRLTRQLFTEGLLLSGVGALAGVTLAVLLLSFLESLAPGDALPRAGEVQIDGWALAFTVFAAVLAAVLFGLFPALRLSGVREASVGNKVRTVTDGGRGIGWNVLVGAEVALSLLLLVGSGLLIRSFWQLTQVDLGFETRQVLTADLALPEADYEDDQALAAFHQRFLADVQTLPGSEHAGIVNILPLSGMNINGSFEIDGRGAGSGYGDYRVASADYFRALGVPLVRGRYFDESDHAGVPDVAIVNNTLAERYWPGEDPIGRRIRNLANDNWVYGGDRWLTVVGVVGDVRHWGPGAASSPEVYVNYAQRPFRSRYATLVVRGSVPPSTLAPAVRARLNEAGVPAEFQTMEARAAAVIGDRRFTTAVLSLFAGVALFLAVVGIYGVISYQVVQRTREIGIRMALGADPRRVRWAVIRGSMVTVAAGLLLGVGGALLLSRVVQSLLFGVTATDPVTFGGVVATLAAAGFIATYLPAHRATRVDPLLALRGE